MSSKRYSLHLLVFACCCAATMMSSIGRVGVTAFVVPTHSSSSLGVAHHASRRMASAPASASASGVVASSARSSVYAKNIRAVQRDSAAESFSRTGYSCCDGSYIRLYSSASSSEQDASNDKARVVFLGTPDVAATSLKTIYEATQTDPACPYEVVGVVTQPPKRRKRRGKEIPSPVGLVAEELDIPVLCPEKARDKDFLDEFENEVRPDLCITAAYGQWLPKRFLATPKFGTLNIHPSLLPRWRGASPVQRSLEAGDQPIGVTVLFTVSKMDAGPIISQEEYEVGPDEQATTVLPHLFEVGTKLLLEAMPDVISGKITMDNAQQQNEDEVVNADMIDSSEGELKVWKEDATTCHNKCRGFSLWPSTYMYFKIGDDEDADAEPLRVKILKTHVLEDKVEPTNIVAMGPNKKDGLRIVCGDGSILEVSQVQPATKKAMDAKSFMNGMRGQTLRWVEIPNEDEDEDEGTSEK